MITTGHDVRGNLVSQTTCQNQAANQCSTEYYTYYPDDTNPAPPPDPRNDLVTTIRDGRSSSATDNRYLTTYTYNAAGNQTSATTPPVAGFPNGRTTTMTYTTATTPAVGGGTTPAGLLSTTTTPGGAVETIGYYSDGDVATVTDPAGEATTYSYDALGRVLDQDGRLRQLPERPGHQLHLQRRRARCSPRPTRRSPTTSPAPCTPRGRPTPTTPTAT